MAEEKREVPTQEEQEQRAIAAAYDELAQETPPRSIEKPETSGDGEKPKTLSEAISSAEDMTDMQYAMSRLFPGSVGFNEAMVGRIDPSVFISMLHLMSNDEIMRSDPTKPIDVNLIYMRNYIRLSIGLDGMGRIDTAELLGAARRQKEAEKLLKGGGL